MEEKLGRKFQNGINGAFKTSSKIRFFNENLGFLTMPGTTGEDCNLYITINGGETFEEVKILESEIYDYYNLPRMEEGKLILRISQGEDWEVLEENEKKYYSEDMGKTWKSL